MKYYVVLHGRTPGLYTSRSDCKVQVDGYTGAVYKSFSTLQAAEFALQEQGFGHKGQSSHDYLRQVMGGDFDYAICTDAACPSNPGPVEYRGVDIATGKELFMVGPLAGGSVNLGEFLAVVHGLSQIMRQNKNILYSDSKTAIGRVQQGHYNTTIAKTSHNGELFTLLDRAVQRLYDHADRSQYIQLRKRPTQQWGQIPADFGRK